MLFWPFHQDPHPLTRSALIDTHPLTHAFVICQVCIFIHVRESLFKSIKYSNYILLLSEEAEFY